MTPRLMYGSLILMMTIACGSGWTGDNNPGAAPLLTAPGCDQPSRITAIYRENVYDLSGYEGIGGNSAFNLFDESDAVDPKGNSNYRPSTSPHPPGAPLLYFPANKGSRIVVDLGVAYRLTEVFLFDRSSRSDSVWIYTGTPDQWRLRAALATEGGILAAGWRKWALDDSSRYVMFRFKSWEAEITEAVLYGCALGPVPARPASTYTGPRLPAKPIREFLGINGYQGVQTRWMKPFYNFRLYTMTSRIDEDTLTPYPGNKYRTSVHGWWNGGINDYVLPADSLVKQMKQRVWYSVLGIPRWMELKGKDNHSRPVTQLGMDSEDPASYARHANMFWNLAASLGTTAVDTNTLQSLSPRFSGRNIVSVFENGNEYDAYWAGIQYCNPVEYFAQSTADYDGHEGRLGSRLGIKQADPGSQLMMAGFCTLDTNRLRVLSFLSKTMRKDGKFIWDGGVQYHHYSTNGKGKLPGEIFSSATGGISPEEDSLRMRLTRVREYTYRVQPGVECILGEWGYDKSRKSKTSTPLVPGHDAQQSQGIMSLRGINAAAFSGFDRMILYWIKDDDGPDQPVQYLSSGVLQALNATEQRPYASWYYIATLVNRLGDYVPEKIITEKGKVWVYKYRHRSDPGLAAYFVYCPTHDGTKVPGYALPVGNLSSGRVSLIHLAEKSETGRETFLNVSGGQVKLTVTESPQFVFVREN